ncbi:MAG: MBL fold metallo-hydrolase [Candidatus Auribacterota bacterium]
MELCVLGSSSNGNATFVRCNGRKFLIDAGFSARIIAKRLEHIGVTTAELDGIFITHEHTDHICGLKGLCTKHDIPVYCTRFTAEAIENQLDITCNFTLFTPSERFLFGDLEVEAFPVFHDAQDPVGFTFSTTYAKLGIISDLGHISPHVRSSLKDVNILIIESNHEEKLLVADIRRPWSLKQRILSRQGHLSNDHACAFIEEIAHDNLRHVLLFHLSKDCNNPDIALAKMKKSLRDKGYADTTVHLTYPNKHSEPLKYYGENTGAEQLKTVFEQLEMPMVP